MAGLRILLTNAHLDGRTGTELYIRDLALGLLAKGHRPVVFSPNLGALAEELRHATVPVVDDPLKVGETPDLIHGHHTHETVTALTAFPGVPAIFVLHDWSATQDEPPLHPRIRRFQAVDETCLDRLIAENGIAPETCEVLLNAVDLARFQPRKLLPVRPHRALVFSNYAREEGTLPLIRAACEAEGLTLDVVGLGVGRSVTAPERLLGDYDLVFGKARAALEAMATGCAVVLCDAHGFGGLVTRQDAPRLRRLNFGRRALATPTTLEGLRKAIRRYDAEDAAAVSAWIREDAALEDAVDAQLSIYQAVIAEHREVPSTREAESRFLTGYLLTHDPRDPRAEVFRAEAASRLRRLQRRPLRRRGEVAFVFGASMALGLATTTALLAPRGKAALAAGLGPWLLLLLFGLKRLRQIWGSR